MSNPKCNGCPDMYHGTCTYADAHIDCEIYREGMGLNNKSEVQNETK